MHKTSNISLKDFRKFLESEKLNKVKNTKGRGGHEKWTKKSLKRPIIIQSHIEPVPKFIVKQVLGQLGVDKKSFLEFMKKR